MFLAKPCGAANPSIAQKPGTDHDFLGKFGADLCGPEYLAKNPFQRFSRQNKRGPARILAFRPETYRGPRFCLQNKSGPCFGLLSWLALTDDAFVPELRQCLLVLQSSCHKQACNPYVTTVTTGILTRTQTQNNSHVCSFSRKKLDFWMRLDVLAATCLISHFFRTCSAMWQIHSKPGHFQSVEPVS